MNTKKIKHTLSSILFASTSLIYFLLAYIGYGKQNLDLTKYSQFENKVIDKGIGIHYGNKGRKSQVFYVALDNLSEKLGIYRMSKNYDDLLNNIKIGDVIKVYYRPSTNENANINIDLIQVEKNDKILISKNEYENKESALIYIGLIAGIGTILLAFRFYKYGYIIKPQKNFR